MSGLLTNLQDAWRAVRGKASSMDTGEVPSWMQDFISGGVAGHTSSWLDCFKSRAAPSIEALVQSYTEICYTCTRINAVAVASNPLRLYQESSGAIREKREALSIGRETRRRLKMQCTKARQQGQREIVEVLDHPLLDMLAEVNILIDGYVNMELLSSWLDMAGNAYWRMERAPDGKVIVLWPTPPQCVTQKNEGGKVYFEINRERVEAEDLQVFRFPNLANPYGPGWSPARAAAETVAILSVDNAFVHAMMFDRGRPDMMFVPKETIGPAEAKRLATRMGKLVSTAQGGKVMIPLIAGDMKSVSFPPKDMETLARAKVSAERLYMAFGVPVALGSSETNLANLQASIKQHARYAVYPRLSLICQAMNQHLVREFGSDLFIWFDDPRAEDDDTEAKRLELLVRSGIITPNEAREDIGRTALEGADELRASSGGPISAPIQLSRKQHKCRHCDTKAKELPTARRFTKALQRTFREQEREVMKALHLTGKAVGEGGALPVDKIDLGKMGMDEGLRDTAEPYYQLYFDRAANETVSRISSLTGHRFNVPPPKVREAINRMNFKFAESTNETTSLEINDAIAKLREELAAGIVEGTNTLDELADRVHGIFDKASDSRARIIAHTESSRAVHHGQRISAKESGVVKGFKWLLSSDACEVCHAIANEHSAGVGLEESFGSTDYGDIQGGDAHPGCRCTITEIIDEAALAGESEAEE